MTETTFDGYMKIVESEAIALIDETMGVIMRRGDAARAATGMPRATYVLMAAGALGVVLDRLVGPPMTPAEVAAVPALRLRFALLVEELKATWHQARRDLKS